MSDVVNLNDPYIKQRLEQLPRDFCGRVTLYYDAGRLQRAEITEKLLDIGSANGGLTLTDARIKNRLERLPADFYGRVLLIYARGSLEDVEVTQSLKPIVDRARTPIAK
jgi:hypothetical protein